ncbi:DnaJ-like subfamily C member 2 [Porphyridium purpureum]|uniref:DnaJ-like subfamily C member 2 n=1 Tax=Porphyridium purpureum TaxID=35688 RepID=A0A5J4Z0Y4_PORPP|nr:DnaJ-like subfamily C member 2 [Porphyridium purpureum]|eukprot:POR9445..scf208_2
MGSGGRSVEMLAASTAGAAVPRLCDVDAWMRDELDARGKEWVANGRAEVVSPAAAPRRRHVEHAGRAYQKQLAVRCGAWRPPSMRHILVSMASSCPDTRAASDDVLPAALAHTHVEHIARRISEVKEHEWIKLDESMARLGIMWDPSEEQLMLEQLVEQLNQQASQAEEEQSTDVKRLKSLRSAERAAVRLQSGALNGLLDDDAESGSATPRTPNDSGATPAAAIDLWSLKRLSSRNKEDYYDLLGLADVRWRASEDDIRRAFRQESMKYHPDKVGGLGEEATRHAEEHFKHVRHAYEQLSDKRKRAAYDSVDEFDDSIPSEKDVTASEEAFYDKLGQTFELNARWSTTNRVPKLGDKDSSMEEVDAFYSFWFAFDSWREFSLDLEFDPDQAESRDEKRWMERQNAKKSKARKVEENARIRALVELAYNNDPRIAGRKEAERLKREQEKERKRKEREDRQAASRFEKERKEHEAEERAQVERQQAAIAKQERDKQKKVIKQLRARVRDAVGVAIQHETDIAIGNAHRDEEHLRMMLDRVCLGLSPEQLEECAENMEKASADGSKWASSVLLCLEKYDASLNQNGSHEHHKNHAKETSGSDGKEKKQDSSRISRWTEDELSLLSKGLTKYPAGTRERWDKVADFIGTKTPKEVQERTAHIREAASKTKPTAALKAGKSVDGPKSSVGMTPGATATESAAGSTAKKQVSGETNGVGGSIKSAAATAAAVVPNAPPNSMNFSKKQQDQLELAMKRHPASLGEERWAKIASEVSGKTPDECSARYKELVAYFKLKKAAASAK